jgi:glycosyltransferase involved in cell wall biosynthesis
VRLLRDALAMLAPSRWNEPFGLSSIESMAVGTPVIGLRIGALPEVVEDGVTGFIADDVPSIADRIARVRFLERGRCASEARTRFNRRTMATSYRAIYGRVA